MFKPCIGQLEADAVAEVLASGWLGEGEKVQEFETKFATYVGAKHAVATNSCTAALHLALYQLGIGPGDEVIVPSITFIGSAVAIELTGATPVFCDVCSDTLLLDWVDVLSKITHKTKAVMPVLYAGQVVEPFDIDIPLVYDCAQAVGSSSWDSKGKICCWSFDPIKNMTTGDGGMITTDDKEFAERGRCLRRLGINKSTLSRVQSDSQPWEYDSSETGFRCGMNDINAAIGLVQLAKLDRLQAWRYQLVDCYRERLKDIVELPPEAACRSSCHMFVIQTPDRDKLALYLRDRGIYTSVHYKPLHLMSRFVSQKTLAISERVWKDLLTLPLHSGMSMPDVNTVCDTIEEWHDLPSLTN